METFSLLQINEYIRRIIALNLPEPVWVTAEIAQASEARGHYFLTLVEKSASSGDIVAQSEAVLWQKTYRRLNRRPELDLKALLQSGRMLRMQVRVDFHERYGHKFMIQDIDPAYTMGLLEQQRRQTIAKLEQAGLLEQNRQHALPLVIQRLAVISSETAAGYQDFIQQLQQNLYGYHFTTRLFPSAMQGDEVRTELPLQLRKIGRQRKSYDAIVLIRGGGSRLDLTAFDELAVAEVLATAPLPVLTGIGHETDQTIADLVAHTALKTPTAVAEWLISRTLEFESHIQELHRQLSLSSRQILQRAQLQLTAISERSRPLANHRLSQQRQRLELLASGILPAVRNQLRDSRRSLDQLERISELMSIDHTLRRGFTLTLRDGHPVDSVQDLESGDQLTIRMQDGSVDSTVNTIHTDEP